MNIKYTSRILAVLFAVWQVSSAVPLNQNGVMSEMAAELLSHAQQLGFKESIERHIDNHAKAQNPSIDPMAGFYEVEKLLIETMNASVNPCVDFEQYACGNYKTIHNRTNDESMVMAIMQRKIFLEMGQWLEKQPNVLLLDAVHSEFGHPMQVPDVDAYAKEVYGVVMELAQATNTRVDKEQVQRDARDIAQLQAEAANTTWGINGWQWPRNSHRYYNQFDVVSALKKWPHINWPFLLVKVAENNTDLYHVFSQPFIVCQPEYFDWLDNIVKYYGERRLTNFILWKLVIAQIAMGENSISNYSAVVHCAGKLTEDLNFAASRIYVDMSGLTNQNLDEINSMVGLVLAAWRGIIKYVHWMSESSKQRAYTKVAYVAKNVAYPSWLMSDKELNAYYKELKVNPDDDNFEATMKFQRFNTWVQFKEMGRKVDRHVWVSSSATVNAWYSPRMNTITIPAAMMSSPVFGGKFPRAYNFASIGTVIGHEVGHAFDDYGIYYDYEGKYLNNTWMDPASRQGFQRMAECVAEQYDHFCLDFHGPHTDCVNGNQTLGENLADNGGVVAAYRAYLALNHLIGEEPLLPANGSLGKLTHEQIFFQSYGHLWCTNTPKDSAIKQLMMDVHSPERFRIIGVVQNMLEFSKAWNCKKGDPMAREKPCSVWHHVDP